MLREVSAGIIPFLIRNNKIEVLLLKYTNYYGFPKGVIEEEESKKDAAIREFYEETGLHPSSLSEDVLISINYNYRMGNELIDKTVHYFGGTIKSDEVVLSEEHRDYEFVPSEDVISYLTFDNTKQAYRAAFLWLTETMLKEYQSSL